MKEYARDNNVNTPEFWDSAWKRNPEDGANKDAVRKRIVAQLATVPTARVYEYGFGNLHLARMIGKDRWRGRDFAPSAIEHAKAEGFAAEVRRCDQPEGFRRSYLVATEVLEHLDNDEMILFLSGSRNAPHAWFSVPYRMGDQNFAQHQRDFGGPEEFTTFLKNFWPLVEVEIVDRYMLAHCMAAADKPILTIGTSTLLDFWGLQFTMASWHHHLGEYAGLVEYVVVDNHPEPTKRLTGCPECEKLKVDGQTCGTCSDNLLAMKTLVEGEGGRYIRWADKQGTYPGKNQLKVEAAADWVITMDSHVFLSPGTVETVLDLIHREPKSNDFYHFPNRMWRAGYVDYRTQDFIYWRKKPCYGRTHEWATPGDPYPIAAMITSCYLVRKEAWFSAHGYDPILGNYGGWEGPLQLKFWLMGRRVLSLRHREPKPYVLSHWHLFNHNDKLKNATGRVHTKWSKIRNFMASSAVIGGEWWAKRVAARWNIPWDKEEVQTGFKAGMALRPWMLENLGRPEWADFEKFLAWMKGQNIPGAMQEW